MISFVSVQGQFSRDCCSFLFFARYFEGIFFCGCCCKCKRQRTIGRIEIHIRKVWSSVWMAHNGFSLLVAEGMESKSMIKRHVDKFRRRAWLRRVCYGVILLAVAAIVVLMGFQPHQSKHSPLPKAFLFHQNASKSILFANQYCPLIPESSKSFI